MVMFMDMREAAAVADVSPKVIRHCLAAEVVKPAQKKAGHWRFSEDDALFFALRAAIPFAIDVKDQKALHALLVGRKRGGGGAGWTRVDEDTIELGAKDLRLSVNFSGIRRDLGRRVALLALREKRIVSRPDIMSGEPVFAGTRVSVSRVGGFMRRGVAMTELKEDFPRLTDEDFELAKLLATIGPGPGRPRRRVPLRFVRDGKRAG